MQNLRFHFESFLKREDATTSVEYAVMLGLILVVAIAAIASLGQDTGGMWGNIQGEMEGHGI